MKEAWLVWPYITRLDSLSKTIIGAQWKVDEIAVTRESHGLITSETEQSHQSETLFAQLLIDVLGEKCRFLLQARSPVRRKSWDHWLTAWVRIHGDARFRQTPFVHALHLWCQHNRRAQTSSNREESEEGNDRVTSIPSPLFLPVHLFCAAHERRLVVRIGLISYVRTHHTNQSIKSTRPNYYDGLAIHDKEGRTISL